MMIRIVWVNARFPVPTVRSGCHVPPLHRLVGHHYPFASQFIDLTEKLPCRPVEGLPQYQSCRNISCCDASGVLLKILFF
jgi:hypothetical protein